MPTCPSAPGSAGTCLRALAVVRIVSVAAGVVAAAVVTAVAVAAAAPTAFAVPSATGLVVAMLPLGMVLLQLRLSVAASSVLGFSGGDAKDY